MAAQVVQYNFILYLILLQLLVDHFFKYVIFFLQALACNSKNYTVENIKQNC